MNIVCSVERDSFCQLILIPALPLQDASCIVLLLLALKKVAGWHHKEFLAELTNEKTLVGKPPSPTVRMYCKLFE